VNEHADRANRSMLHYENAASASVPGPEREVYLARVLAEAQVHATLAVAYELRDLVLSYTEANV
jgi:hypothetical protein